MKSFNIDLETIESLGRAGMFLELQGSMNVRPESEPLEQVHQSSLFMTLATAEKLRGLLQNALQQAHLTRMP